MNSTSPPLPPLRSSSDDEVEPFQENIGLSEEHKTGGVKPEKKLNFAYYFSAFAFHHGKFRVAAKKTVQALIFAFCWQIMRAVHMQQP